MLLLIHLPLALLEILALVLGLMAETQLDQTMHKVPIINKSHPQYIANYVVINLTLATSIIPVYSSLLQAQFPPLFLQQNVLYPSKIGLYPVHLHRLPIV